LGRDGGFVGLIWGGGEADYFCGRGWTGQIRLKLLRKIVPSRSAPIAPVSRPWGLAPSSSALYHIEPARIRCTGAGIPVTLGHDKNKEYEGGTIETFNRCGMERNRLKLFEAVQAFLDEAKRS
jgi:hypothetical protein